ncbi:MAG TPA: ABC transporter permease [Acidimicrobiales bacterium]|jgi:ABC-2 type transport system permease protein/lipopolysaccharide transport system permease protein|nr:ABC transporter permease [Acidimicrobiales bacterium]
MTATSVEPSEPATEPPAGLRFRRHLGFREAMAELWQARELIRTLVERDLRIRYKQTVLGFGWAVVGPVVFMLVFTVFFQSAGHFATAGVPYALFSYTALVPWTFFAEGVTLGSMSLISNLMLLNKVYCPREVFPIATVITAAFDAAVSALVLLVLFAIYQYPPAITTLWVPVLIALEVAFTLGVTLFASSVLIYLRDVRYVVPLAVQVGMFASPVIYGINVIPAGLRPAYAIADPLGPIIASFRLTVLHNQPPDWGLLGLAALASAAWLTGGYALFKRLETGIADIA